MREILQIGLHSREWVVSRSHCPALAKFQIICLGNSDAGTGFNFDRPAPRMTQILACTGGSGEVKLEGRWQKCTKGMAYVTPPGIPHSYRSMAGSRWNLCWVMYDAEKHRQWKMSFSEPTLVKLDPRILYHSIQILFLEVNGNSNANIISSLLQVIELCSARIVQPQQSRSRLWFVWEKVQQHLDEPWDAARLSRTAHLSFEHLRRLCHAECGCSPMQQVGRLRMQRAAVLLETTSFKLETIAHSVGYSDPFAFSNTFRRILKIRPSEYRRKLAAHVQEDRNDIGPIASRKR